MKKLLPIRKLSALPDKSTQQEMLASANQLEKELAEMKKSGSQEHCKMALMGTKMDIDRALATGRSLPWPISNCQQINIKGKLFDVVNRRDRSTEGPVKLWYCGCEK